MPLTLRKLGPVLTDRKSRYAVSGCPVTDAVEIAEAVELLKQDKAYRKATHNSWGAVLSRSGALKADDGEAGAGLAIVRMLERDGVKDHLVIVTRWYGGKHLGGDRFRHVTTCVRAYLESLKSA